MAQTTITLQNAERYSAALRRMAVEGRQEFGQLLEAEGMSLLALVQREIVALQVVDTRRLLNSFDKGSGGNIWTLSNGGLTLDVGTNVKYAQAVNDGHRQKKRWVPGTWSGNKFTYEPGAKTGMMLKEKFVPGKPYWDTAIRMFEQIFNTEVETWFRNRVAGWRSEL